MEWCERSARRCKWNYFKDFTIFALLIQNGVHDCGSSLWRLSSVFEDRFWVFFCVRLFFAARRRRWYFYHLASGGIFLACRCCFFFAFRQRQSFCTFLTFDHENASLHAARNTWSCWNISPSDDDDCIGLRVWLSHNSMSKENEKRNWTSLFSAVPIW